LQEPISGGAAAFQLQSLGHTAAAVQTLVGPGKSASATLLPGSYQLSAHYSGDARYGPADGIGSLVIGKSCPLVSLSA